MSKVDEAVECFCGGAACSQAIVGTYGVDYGLTRTQAMKLASGFAGGMRLGETCGAVTGTIRRRRPRIVIGERPAPGIPACSVPRPIPSRRLSITFGVSSRWAGRGHRGYG